MKKNYHGGTESTKGHREWEFKACRILILENEKYSYTYRSHGVNY